MAKYKKKPVVVEAIKWTGENFGELVAFAKSDIWFDDLGTLWIDTLEGDMTARAGDYIIKGIKGEFYPCKADIFAETYEEVDEA